MKPQQKLEEEAMPLVDKFMVRVILSKLTTSYDRFYQYAHYKKAKIKFEDLIRFICIDDEVRNKLKVGSMSKQFAKAIMLHMGSKGQAEDDLQLEEEGL